MYDNQLGELAMQNHTETGSIVSTSDMIALAEALAPEDDTAQIMFDTLSRPADGEDVESGDRDNVVDGLFAIASAIDRLTVTIQATTR